jgi:hypothetical protein
MKRQSAVNVIRPPLRFFLREGCVGVSRLDLNAINSLYPKKKGMKGLMIPLVAGMICAGGMHSSFMFEVTLFRFILQVGFSDALTGFG